MSQQRLLVSARQKQSSMSSISSKMVDSVSVGNFGKQVAVSTLGRHPNHVNVEGQLPDNERKGLPSLRSIVLGFECDDKSSEMVKDSVRFAAEQEFAQFAQEKVRVLALVDVHNREILTHGRLPTAGGSDNGVNTNLCGGGGCPSMTYLRAR